MTVRRFICGWLCTGCGASQGYQMESDDPAEEARVARDARDRDATLHAHTCYAGDVLLDAMHVCEVA